MKETQLLEAIGHIREDLLQESKPRAVKGVWRVALVAALMAIMAITAGALGVQLFHKGSNTMANTVTSGGRFAYADGYYYCGTGAGIYRVNAETGETRLLPLAEGVQDPRFLIMTDRGISYITDYDTLWIQNGETPDQLSLPEGSNLCRVYAEGSVLYTNDGAEFCRIDLNTGEKTVLLENVHSYFVDESRIYALTQGNCFLRSPKDRIDFERVPLSFHPAGILADGERLYFTEYLRGDKCYRVICYENGQERELPIFGYFMQKLGESLLYLDGQTLKRYDPADGSITPVAENVYEFAVLNGSTLCIYHYGGNVTIGDYRINAAGIIESAD